MDFDDLTEDIRAEYDLDGNQLSLTFDAVSLFNIAFASFNEEDLNLDDLGVTQEQLQSLVAQLGDITLQMRKTN